MYSPQGSDLAQKTLYSPRTIHGGLGYIKTKMFPAGELYIKKLLIFFSYSFSLLGKPTHGQSANVNPWKKLCVAYQNVQKNA